MATIEIPDALYQRLLSLGCATTDFYVTALEEALSRRHVVTEPKRMGRPLKGDRLNVTMNLERRYLKALDEYADKLGISRADAINKVLGDAIMAGIMPDASDG